MIDKPLEIPTGMQTLLISKLYYGILTKSLDKLAIDRYFAVLLFLKDQKNCCQQVICDNLLIDKAAMVKVLDYLSKAGLIERVTNPNDRREHFIILSKKGEKQTSEIRKVVTYIEQKTFENVSKQEEMIFKKVLQRVGENLKEMPSNKIVFNYKTTKKNNKK